MTNLDTLISTEQLSRERKIKVISHS